MSSPLSAIFKLHCNYQINNVIGEENSDKYMGISTWTKVYNLNNSITHAPCKILWKFWI